MKIQKFLLASLTTALLIAWGFCAVADDSTSKLTNQSKQKEADGYYLVQETIVGEDDCVKVEGEKKLNPGDSAQLKIKDGCKWGVVRYKIFSVKDNKEIGKLGHSYHDGNFTIEITSMCEGSDCNFTGLTPKK